MTATLAPDMPVVEHEGRTLDWRPRFDPRSLDYRVAAVAGTKLPTTGRVWRHGTVLDQGSEGACVGMGCAGEAAAEPVPVPGVTSRYALGWYRNAQRRDVWPGEAYSGTSVLAGVLEGRARGVYTGVRWAKSAEELAAGIVLDEKDGGGPAIIGVEWRQGSYDTDALGVLRPSGDVVGGHCLCVLGFVPNGTKRESALGQQLVAAGLWEGAVSVGAPVFVVLNSWGLGFGQGGLCLVPLDAMRAWVRARGEFAIPQGRQLPKARRIAAPKAQPATAAPVDETVHVRADQLRVRDRIVDRVPAELDQETATVQSRRLVAGWDGERVRVQVPAGAFTLRASEQVTARRPVA